MYAKMDEVDVVLGNQEKLDAKYYSSLRANQEAIQRAASAAHMDPLAPMALSWISLCSR
jgi:hypothetical protein